MNRLITYTEEQVSQLKGLLNAVTVTGIQNARQITAMAQILDTGILAERNDKEETDDTE